MQEMVAGKKEDGRMKANVQCSIFNGQLDEAGAECRKWWPGRKKAGG